MLAAALAALEADSVGSNELAPAPPAVADLESLAIQVPEYPGVLQWLLIQAALWS
jgi:hypothetical protein